MDNSAAGCWDTDSFDTDYSDNPLAAEWDMDIAPAADVGYDCGPLNMSQSSLVPNGSTVSMEYPENRVNGAMITNKLPSD